MKTISIAPSFIGLVLLLALFSPCWAFGGGGGKGSGPVAPEYYSYEDLVNQCSLKAYAFYCDDSKRPSQALADLPPYPANEITMPARFKARLTERLEGKGAEIKFEWEKLPFLREGQLVFQRADSWVGRCEQFFTSFTHVSVIYSIPDRMVLESLKYTDENGVDHNGVGIYPSDSTWKNMVTYSVKDVVYDPDAKKCAENASKKYAGIPYFPKVSTLVDIFTFYHRWSDKNNIESMYCSKLVWNAFKDDGIDLDSNATCSMVDNNLINGNGEPSNGWIGVSPDDIYYSNMLGQDVYLEGAENLGQPIFPLI